MIEKIFLTGRIKDKEVFVPINSQVVLVGYVGIRNLTLVVDNYFERAHGLQEVILYCDPSAVGFIDGISFTPSLGSWERWQTSPHNPYRKTGLWSSNLQHSLSWSES